MDVRCYRNWDQMDIGERDWNALAGDVPFRRWEWLKTWWDHFGRDGQLFVVAVRQPDQQLVAVAPWYIRRDLSGARVLHFLGSGKVCSDYLTVMTPRDGELWRPGIAGLAEWLVQVASRTRDANRWDLMDLEGAAASDDVIRILAERLKTLGSGVRMQEGGSCWRMAVCTTWENYLQRLSKPLRRKVRTLKKRYLDTGLVQGAVARNAEEVRDMLGQLVELHQRRRSSLGERGCFEFPQFYGFMRDAADKLHHAGLLNLVTIRAGTGAVAASLGIVLGGVHYVYQCGMDPEQKQHQPGWLLNIWHLVQAGPGGHRAIDLLRGDERYKADLGCQPIALTRWRICAPRVAAQLRFRWWLTQDSLKQWYRRYGTQSQEGGDLRAKHKSDVK